MTVLNDLDGLPLVMDTVDRGQSAGAEGTALRKQLENEPIERVRFIENSAHDLPEIRNRKWPA